MLDERLAFRLSVFSYYKHFNFYISVRGCSSAGRTTNLNLIQLK